MATTYLPSGFKTREEYFESSLRLLCQYEWLFNWPVTQILSCGMLDELPLEWWEPLQRLSLKNLNELPRGVCHDRWPESLKRLVAACTALRLPVADLLLPLATHMEERLRHALRKGMTPKKVHEVTHLAAVIHEQCSAAGIQCVVDMGSGHGYLCEVLHHCYGYRVLGLESVAARVEESGRRHADICRAMGKPVSGHVRYLECDVSADNPAPIAAALAQDVDEEGLPLPFCLVGLHSCGDLTPHAVRLFQTMPQIRSMVLVACCYHRMGLAPAPPHCPTAAASPADLGVWRGRPAERQRKAMRVLQWQVRRWCRGHVDEDPAEVVRLAVQWLGPRGPLLAARAPPAPEHFFNFPLSASLRRLTRCGQPQPWSPSASTVTSAASNTVTSTESSTSSSTTSLVASSTACSEGNAPTACSFLRRPMLRLAAQETVERWEKMSVETHQRHSRHVMARAVFELYASASGLQLARRGSRCLRGAALSLDAHAVLAEMVQRLVTGAAPDELDRHKKALCTLYEALEPLRPLVEALTALQSALQNVCEGLVLVDRLACLAAGVDDKGAVTVVKVADQLQTPRCYALVATK